MIVVPAARDGADARLATARSVTPASRAPDEFAVMRAGAILVNVGRGHVVDEEALAVALRERRLRAATLDVFADEPLPPASPLWYLDSVPITPHVAGGTPAHMHKAVDVFVQSFRSWQREGRLTTAVDVTRGY